MFEVTTVSYKQRPLQILLENKFSNITMIVNPYIPDKFV